VAESAAEMTTALDMPSCRAPTLRPGSTPDAVAGLPAAPAPEPEGLVTTGTDTALPRSGSTTPVAPAGA